MLKLIRKDLILNRNALLIAGLLLSLNFVWFSVQMDSYRPFLVFTGLMVGLVIPLMVQAREDRFRTGVLTCSLPFTRSTLVLSKFVTAWVLMLLGLGFGLLLAAVNPWRKMPLAPLFEFKNILLILFFVSLFFTILLPFIIRFGLTGVMIFLVVSQVLGVIALMTGQLFRQRGNPVRIVLGAVVDGLRYLLNHEGTAVFLLALAAAILVVNAVSLRISQALYARREF